MHLHWERSSNTAGDCIIRSLSWMGRVPDEIPQVGNMSIKTNEYLRKQDHEKELNLIFQTSP
jgi:hypothetical protein